MTISRSTDAEESMSNEHRAQCEDCKWFSHYRRSNGRIDRKHFGACNYVVVWPKSVPLKYGDSWQDPRPSQAVWWNSNAERCQCFERNS